MKQTQYATCANIRGRPSHQNLAELAALAESHAEPELAVHFHVYLEDKVLLQWHDAFGQALFLDGSIPKEQVKLFAEALNMTFKLNTEHAIRTLKAC